MRPPLDIASFASTRGRAYGFAIGVDHVAAYWEAVGGVAGDACADTVPSMLLVRPAMEALHDLLARVGVTLDGALHVAQLSRAHAVALVGEPLEGEARVVRAARLLDRTAVDVEVAVHSAAGPVSTMVVTVAWLSHVVAASEDWRPRPAPGAGAPLARALLRVSANTPTAWATASGDSNPIHLDDAAAATAGLEHRIAHGWSIFAGVFEATRAARDWPDVGLSAAARFARPVSVPSDIDLEILRTPDDHVLLARCKVDGKPVLRDVVVAQAPIHDAIG